ncbi:MAG TPA: PilZ domain-containing protein [Terriglobia bacterium]|nr:PilZ domain-containing protein [Terriglobia bacterium]
MSQQSELSQRAGRYPVKTAIRFRVSGQDQWYEGVTENISRTGVFLRSQFLPRTGSKVEMVLSLPSQVLGKRTAEVFGHGRVVRRARFRDLDPQLGMAATIDRYRLTRKAIILEESPSKS